jgi:CheY-like chemotaxis protein
MPIILIAEDEFAIAELLEMALVDAGYEVVTAANGRQAMDRLRAGLRPDLIITDFMMPEMNGAGLVAALRGDAAYGDIPCVVMSSVPEETVRARIDGFQAFVRKPFELSALLHLVSEIVPPSVQPQSEGD